MTKRTITTIDCGYLEDEFAAAYLIADSNEVAFVDNNTAHSVPRLLSALKQAGYAPDQVRYLIVTHIHLDHAGGTSALLKFCPQATVLVHPRGARHLIDPSRLLASAKHVYGEARFQELYGVIEPIDASRVREISDGESVALGTGRPLRFFHTRGHANHHFVVRDPENAAVFTGDSFGLVYPVLQKQGLFAIPSTSPTEFDFVEAIRSIELILGLAPQVVYPTHYGAVVEVSAVAEQLKTYLLESEQVLRAASTRPETGAALTDFCRQSMDAVLSRSLRSRGIWFGEREFSILKLDLDLNAQGLAFVAEKARSPAVKN